MKKIIDKDGFTHRKDLFKTEKPYPTQKTLDEASRVKVKLFGGEDNEFNGINVGVSKPINF